MEFVLTLFMLIRELEPQVGVVMGVAATFVNLDFFFPFTDLIL